MCIYIYIYIYTYVCGHVGGRLRPTEGVGLRGLGSNGWCLASGKHSDASGKSLKT